MFFCTSLAAISSFSNIDGPITFMPYDVESGFRIRSREPAIKIDGSETLRDHVDILLLELMKAYIF